MSDALMTGIHTGLQWSIAVAAMFDTLGSPLAKRASRSAAQQAGLAKALD